MVLKVTSAAQAFRVNQARMVFLVKLVIKADQVLMAEEAQQGRWVPEGLQEHQDNQDSLGPQVHWVLLVHLVQLGRKVILVYLDLRDLLALREGQDLKEALGPGDRRASKVILETRELWDLQGLEDCREKMVQMAMESQEPKDRREILVFQVTLDFRVNGVLKDQVEVVVLKATEEEQAMLEGQDNLEILGARA